MGFQCFDGKNWKDITREERYFCSELYYAVKGSENAFVNWLNKNAQLGLTQSEVAAEWECGFEVCFYRDYNKRFLKKAIRNTQYSPKRTFDLCLFSEKVFIIIEAKAFENFLRKQVNSFKSDRKLVRSIIRDAKRVPPAEVKLVALAPSDYVGRTRVRSDFDGLVSWAQIAIHFNNPVFDRADSLKLS
jgi:hypothetical protein